MGAPVLARVTVKVVEVEPLVGLTAMGTSTVPCIVKWTSQWYV
jgi:hypothetical protein